MKLNRTVLAAAGGAAVIAALVLWPRARVAETVTVARQSILQSVVATGRVSTPARLDIGAQVTGTIDKVLVREGDYVKAGQAMVILRNDEAQATLVQARAALVEARARVAQLEAVTAPLSVQAVKQAEANLRVAEAEYRRTQDLVAQGFYSQSKADDAARALDNARSALASSRTQAEANTPAGVEARLALSRVGQAEAGLAAAKARADNMRIEAPAAAIVLVRNAEPGSIAQPGRVLLTLAQNGETRIDAPVDEKNLRYIRPGFRANAVADAFPAERFAAEVYYIAPSVDPQRGTVEVRLRVPNPPPFLRPDMTVSVEMLVGSKQDALVVPSDAVRAFDTMQPNLLVLLDGRAVRVPVAVGLTGIGSTEIAQGLAEGDQVIVDAAAVEGERVRAKPRDARPKEKGPLPPAGITGK